MNFISSIRSFFNNAFDPGFTGIFIKSDVNIDYKVRLIFSIYFIDTNADNL